MINVYIVSGFLGAGKTTFIQHLLENKKFSKVMLLENEFGEVGVDGAFFDNFGVPAQIKTPKVENNLDEYINYVDDDFYTVDSVVVPKFQEYRTVLSQLGQTAEEDYPLEILIPSALHLPRNSRIILNEYDSGENKTSREWRVLTTEVKQLSNSKSYTRIAYCVPARANIYITAKIEPSKNIVFYDDIINYQIYNNLKAYSVNYVKVNEVNNRTENITVNAAAEACTYVKWKIKLPSILY